MQTIYRLRDDTKHIAQVQRATLTTEDFGVEPTHGLFGSDEWWANVGTTDLPIHTLHGTIARVYMGSMNDWPEFELTSQSGDVTTWSRYANSAAAARLYEVGRPVRLDYVLQKFRAKAWWAREENKVVLEIQVGDVA